MALLRRGRGTDSQWIAQEFAKAADPPADGRPERSRERYARLARRLATAPEDVRHYRGLALLREAEAILAMGIFTDALTRFREAYPLLTDPGRQLPRWVVRQFAEERLREGDGGIEPLTIFLRALADGVEPGDEETAVRVVAWLQRRCLTEPPGQREVTARAAVAALPGVDWPVLALTTELRRAGRVADAESLLAGAAARGSGDLWFRWGIQLSTLMRYDEAIAAYDEALRRGAGPGSPWSRGPWLRPEAMLFRGLAQQQLGRNRQADDDLRAASALAPQDPRIHYSLGRLAVGLGANAEAWNHFATALTVEAGFAPARLGLALLREQAGRPAEAIGHYQAAVRHDPGSRAARIRLGAALVAAGRREEAEGLLRPETDGSYWGGMAAFHYGLARLRADDPAQAIEVWDRLPGNGELREWTATARDREARIRLATDPAAARLQWQLALLDAPHVAERRTALREAALREAAWLLLADRDDPVLREKASVALELGDDPEAEKAAAAATSGVAAAPGPTSPDLARRRKRLRAALGLVGGAPELVEGLLEPTADPRDVCHLATAALVTGRLDRAEALLAQVPVDPDGDPGIARLRALIAERREDWSEAVRWYQRFLTNDISARPRDAGDVPSVTDAYANTDTDVNPNADTIVTTAPVDTDKTLVLDLSAIAAEGDNKRHIRCHTSATAACTRRATHSCAGCGREGCAAHLYRPAGADSFRCERCLEPALQSLVFCARKAGTPEEAEPVLARWAAAMAGHPGTRGLHRRIALLRAETGDLDGALARLPVEADGERVNLLIRRAAGAIERGEPYSAIADLRHALRIQPGQPEATAALAALAEYEARQHAAAGRHEAAFEAYLTLVRSHPTNPRLLHALGLSAHQLAKASGDQELWQWTIGCLVSALHTPAFWTEAAGPDRPPPTSREITESRRHLLDQLREDLREADTAAQRTGDEADAWTVRLGVDVAACEALSDTGDGAKSPRAVTSPTLSMLLDPEQRASASAAALRWYGPFGPHHYLCEDGRYAAAIRALDAVSEADRDTEWTGLLHQALALRGLELHLEEQWPAALEHLARAASVVPGGEVDAVLAEAAAESAWNAARALRDANVPADPDTASTWPQIIHLLEQAFTVAPDAADLRAELGLAHMRRAAELRTEGTGRPQGIGRTEGTQGTQGTAATNGTDYLPILAHLRRALDLRPADPEATELLTAVLAERATALTRPGPDKDLLEAVQWWEELSELSPNPAHNAGLSRALSLLACSAALADHRSLALDRMTWSLQADPGWTGDIDRDPPRKLAALLIADAMDGDRPRPFAERAHRLRAARTYRDSPELRDLMIALWKNEASFQYETRHYGLCAALLEEAIRLADEPEATVTARPHPLPEVDAVHWLRYPQARNLIRRTVAHYTDEETLRELHLRSRGAAESADA